MSTQPSLSYQWKKDGTNIPQANGSTFSLSNLTLADAAEYSVEVSGTCNPAVVSQTAVLVVNQAPLITSQPVDELICAGGSTSFSVATSNATGYQWQVDGGGGFVNLTNTGFYSGATTATLSITGAQGAMNGNKYRVVVNGSCTPPTSTVATLTVNTLPDITHGPVGATRYVGEQASFEVTATGTDLVYQWKKNGTNIPGATGSSYNIASTVVGDAGSYTVEVGAACGSSVISDPSQLIISVPPSITSQPAAVSICSGSNASFIVGVSNATGFQWQVNKGSGFVNLDSGGVYSGVNTATLSITGATTTLNGYQYRVIASGTCPPVAISTAATLNVDNPAVLGSFTPLAGPVLIGSSVNMSIAFSGSTPCTAIWNWNDGTTSNATVVGSTLTGSHVYALRGVYTPTLTVNSRGLGFW